MTIRDYAAGQYNSIRSSYTNNMMAVSSQQQTQSVSSTSRITPVRRTNSDSLQFLNQYQSQMNGLASAAGKIRSLSKDSVWSNLNISSSDEAIVSNATAYGKVPQRAEYEIEVKQLAQKQTSEIAAADITGDFHIQFTNGAGEEVTANIQIDSSITDKNGQMQDIADKINQYEGNGIKASLVKDDDGNVTSIKVEGEYFGKDFKIDGIDPGKVDTKKAQDLIYTLNGETHTASGNHNIQIDPSGDNKSLRLNFDGVGKATIKADVDTEKLAKYTEKFVDTYNKTIDFLVDNAHRGSGVTNALDRFMQSPLDSDAMAAIGLHFGADGKITFEADEFKAAMEKDTRKVYDILADNYSVADTIYQKADKASNASVTSLLDKSQLQNNSGGITIINNYNYYMTAPNPFYSPFYSPFLFSGSLFFNAKV